MLLTDSTKADLRFINNAVVAVAAACTVPAVLLVVSYIRRWPPPGQLGKGSCGVGADGNVWG